MERQRTSQRLKQNRRELRATMTKAEQLLWAVVRNRRLNRLKFRRQHPIANYIVDFVCLEHMLVIELDGEYHAAIVEEDLKRQRRLEELSYRVLRFWNEDVLEDVEVIARAIRNAIANRVLLPRGGEDVRRTDEGAERAFYAQSTNTPSHAQKTPHPNPLPFRGERGQSQGGSL